MRLFYNNQLVKRKGAMPSFIQGSLFGKDSVHTLDDEEHLHRKATFVKVCYCTTLADFAKGSPN